MKNYMVKDGKRVAPTCSECGCRLRTHDDGSLSHFMGPMKYDGSYAIDAKGHKCGLLTVFWVTTKQNKLIGAKTSSWGI